MADKATGGASPFDVIRHEDEETGGEYWSARELGPLLGYSGWQRFSAVIAKATTACEQSGHTVSDHFNARVKMVALGSGAQRAVEDVHLSRYACYLVVMNGDADKPIIAAGQTYFAEQTRRQELLDELAALPEAQRRLHMRNAVVDRNMDLSAAAQAAGVVTGRDFATFQDHGYRGLYNGETARDIHARKGLAKSEKILDWMGSEELAANWFRITQTEAKLQREGITGKAAANQTHHAMGKAVRQFIADQGGTMPEDLPTPAQSIRQIERAEAQRLEAERQPSLFPPDEPPDKG
jgi:DNA-damage-inducible protein D